MWALWLAGCVGGGDSDAPVYGPLDRVVQVPCEAAGDEGLAVRAQAGAASRHGGAWPVVVRVWPPHRSGFEDVVPTAPALDAGLAIVRLLDPGEGADGVASGGPVGESGAARVAAIQCAIAWARASFPRPVSTLTVTGVSLGGNAVLHAVQDEAVDGVVLFEPPLVDQLVADETSPGEVDDPTFVPGSCALSSGCPFPGRADRLRWIDGDLVHDVDEDGVIGASDPVLRRMPDPSGGSLGFVSRELFAEVEANASAVFGGPAPTGWPDAASTAAYWAARDATEPLQRVSEEGLGSYLLVATAQDHLQRWHEHARLGAGALSAAGWFRLNPDAAYVAAAGGPAVDERPAFEVPAEWEAEGALPDGPDDRFILAAELEVADRAWVDDRSPDLSTVIVP